MCQRKECLEDTMLEQWKTFAHTYQISNYGRVRNIATDRILIPRIKDTGYYQITLSLGGRSKKHTFKIHRLVAEQFIPNPDNLPQVNHIDGNKLNNCVDNLEWCNQSHNIQHAMALGLYPQSRK